MSHNDVHNVSDDVATENSGVDFETQDLNIKAIVWFGVGLLTVTIASMVLIWGVLASMDGSTNTTSPSALTIPPEPRLQPNPIDKTSSPTEMLHQEMANQEKWLHSYGWVDKEAGMARMPIDEAMKMTVEEYQ
jgi:hypothetical protein